MTNGNPSEKQAKANTERRRQKEQLRRIEWLLTRIHPREGAQEE